MLTLAAASDYLKIWQLPLFGVFIVGWIVGGGYLFHHTLSKKVQTRRGVSLGQGMLISLLSGMAGGIAGLVLYMVGDTAMPPAPPASPGEAAMPISIFGVVLGLLGYMVVAWLTVFAMQKLSAGEILKASVLPIGATVGLAVAVGLGAAIPAAIQVRRERAQFALMSKNLNNMIDLHDWVYERGWNDPVKSLAVLKNFAGFDQSLLKNAAAPDREIGYFYHPAPSTKGRMNADPQLLMCDPKGIYGDFDARIVLYSNGVARKLDEARFRDELNEPQNQDFAEALRKAEGS
jgi:hypothetical protein